jgi:hypothetical protein
MGTVTVEADTTGPEADGGTPLPVFIAKLGLQYSDSGHRRGPAVLRYLGAAR